MSVGKNPFHKGHKGCVSNLGSIAGNYCAEVTFDSSKSEGKQMQLLIVKSSRIEHGVISMLQLT
jgi:hypothetical protein